MKEVLLLALSLISLTSLFSSQAFAAGAAPQTVTGCFVFKNTGTEVTGQFATLPASDASAGQGVTCSMKVSADSSGKGVTAQMIPQ